MLKFIQSPLSGRHLPVTMALAIAATALIATPQIEARVKSAAAERIAAATMSTIDKTSIVFLQAGGQDIADRRRSD